MAGLPQQGLGETRIEAAVAKDCSHPCEWFKPVFAPRVLGFARLPWDVLRV